MVIAEVIRTYATAMPTEKREKKNWRAPTEKRKKKSLLFHKPFTGVVAIYHMTDGLGYANTEDNPTTMTTIKFHPFGDDNDVDDFINRLTTI